MNSAQLQPHQHLLDGNEDSWCAFDAFSRPDMTMPYFERHYEDFRWPVQSEDRPGFRLPQVGALHAIAAHFSQRTDRSIITMPTGSGKTAVLCASAFVLRAARVLVITPSRLVREQILEDFGNLAILKRLGSLAPDVPAPATKRVASKIRTIEDWNLLREYDVVVGTPASLSPGAREIPEPPADLFDLVLVDEAHHSPAATWTALLDHFRGARQVLFTATPFRADQLEIKGRFAYTYDIQRAFDDGVYGQIEYQPIRPGAGEDPDLAIARAAERTLQADRAAGLDHLLMVRTSQRTRAVALHDLYTRETGLRLAIVTGDQSLSRVRRTLEQLAQRELDGIVCVDMLGEGFDLPSLKIAALHSPYKSLAVTLQFIGRFARTTAPQLGRATFLALTSDMSVEREQLYLESAAWERIIPALAAERIAAEQNTQEVLESFESRGSEFSDVPDMSLYAIRPYFHVKVLNTGSNVNVFQDIEMPGSGEVVYRYHSVPRATALYVVRSRARPRWTTAAHLDSISHELYILHLHRESGFLFICSSRRDDDLYQHFATAFATAGAPVPRGLSSSVLQRALGGLDGLRFLNIGMRNSAATDRNASYITMAGSAVDQQVDQNDGRRFHRGHYFATAQENGRGITLGVSTGSKVWSNTADRLPALIEWCDKIADKLTHGAPPRTNTGLDHLGFGQAIDNLPPDIVSVDWDRDAYAHPKSIEYVRADGTTVRSQLLDLEFCVERGRTAGNTVALLLKTDGYEYRLTFSYDSERLIEPADDKQEPVLIGDHTIPLTAYLNERYPTFYTSRLAYIVAGDEYDFSGNPIAPFDSARIETRDWTALGVDIATEVTAGDRRRRSLHSWLEEDLAASTAQVVFYDHGTGEVADFIAFEERQGEVLVTFYHCKKSSGPRPGARVDDVYEVCGQAIKSRNWDNLTRLFQLIQARLQSRPGRSRLVKGDIDTLRALIGPGQLVQTRLQVTIVQPGIGRNVLTEQVASILAAADEFVFGQRFDRLRVIGSE